jgi:hypothetical protein
MVEMTRPLDQSLLETVTALVDGLEHANVSYCLIGALVPELLLKTPPPRRTNDADAVVQVETLEEFERVKSALELEPYGFTRTRGPFRMERGPGRVDVLPYSEALAPGGLLRIPPSTPYNMLGFDKVHRAQTRVTIAGGPTVPLVTIPLYVLLKIVAYSDRREARDGAGRVKGATRSENSERRSEPLTRPSRPAESAAGATVTTLRNPSDLQAITFARPIADTRPSALRSDRSAFADLRLALRNPVLRFPVPPRLIHGFPRGPLRHPQRVAGIACHGCCTVNRTPRRATRSLCAASIVRRYSPLASRSTGISIR